MQYGLSNSRKIIKNYLKSFCLKIIYRHLAHTNNLFILLEYLGVLKEASYAQFGMGDIKALQISKKVYDNFKILEGIMKETANAPDIEEAQEEFCTPVGV